MSPCGVICLAACVLQIVPQYCVTSLCRQFDVAVPGGGTGREESGGEVRERDASNFGVTALDLSTLCLLAVQDGRAVVVKHVDGTPATLVERLEAGLTTLTSSFSLLTRRKSR